MPRGGVQTASQPKKGRGVAPKAHKLAEELPIGTVLQDLFKKKWHLGGVIGKGGFGLIYLASEDSPAAASGNLKTADHVIKIEPVGNGPLYCEMQFYQRAARQNTINSFIINNHLRYLGVPPFVATGQHAHKQQRYRFLVMPRFGTDLQKLLIQNGGRFPAQAVFAVGLRMLDALQYLHENEYAHADIKAANILLGNAKGSSPSNEVYLVDYGLAYRYTVEGVHKEYKEDPRKAHDGTIEFTSRDAHRGLAPARRGDLEILGYCMLQWLCGRLPWEDNLGSPNYVADSKEKYMGNVHNLVTTCIPGAKSNISECMRKYMEAVNKLQYNSTPNYNNFRTILRHGLDKGDEWKIELIDRPKVSKGKETDWYTCSLCEPSRLSSRRSSRISNASGESYLSDEEMCEVLPSEMTEMPSQIHSSEDRDLAITRAFFNLDLSSGPLEEFQNFPSYERFFMYIIVVAASMYIILLFLRTEDDVRVIPVTQKFRSTFSV